MTMTNTKTTHGIACLIARSDDELLDEFDELVANAAYGDARAVGAIAIAFGPTLLDEARDELGPEHEQDACDCLQDLCVKLMEGELLFPSIRHAGLPWLKRMIREIGRRTVLAHEAGFADLAHFSWACRRALGYTPSRMMAALRAPVAADS